MGIGLTFDEYVELTAKPPAGADPAFHEAVKEERERMFPMTLVVGVQPSPVARLRLPAGNARLADSRTAS